MKKFIFILLMIFITKNLWADSVVEVTIPDTIALPAGTVQIPINVSDVSGLEIMSYQFHITFDDSVLNFSGLDTNNALSQSWAMYSNDDNQGNIFIGGYGAILSGVGTLIYLNFDVVGDLNDMTNLSFSDFQFNEGEPIANYANPLSVVKITYDFNNDGTVDISDVKILFQNWGYQYDNFDVNGDNKIDILDIQKVIANLE